MVFFDEVVFKDESLLFRISDKEIKVIVATAAVFLAFCILIIGLLVALVKWFARLKKM
jgi:hypothetical protein